MTPATDRLSIKLLQRLINQALRLDPEAVAALAELQTKIIAVEFTETQIRLFFFPTENGITLCDHYSGQPDVFIKGTMSNFIMLMISEPGSASASHLQIIGDVSLAQRFQDIIKSLDIDMEEQLAQYLGDAAAYRLGRLFVRSSQLLQHTGKTFALDVSEYLLYEKELLPDKLRLEEFCHAVDTLRDDVERIQQRLDKLTTNCNN